MGPGKKYTSRYDIKLYVSSWTSREMSLHKLQKMPIELARGARQLKQTNHAFVEICEKHDFLIYSMFSFQEMHCIKKPRAAALSLEDLVLTLCDCLCTYFSLEVQDETYSVISYLLVFLCLGGPMYEIK